MQLDDVNKKFGWLTQTVATAVKNLEQRATSEEVAPRLRESTFG